jgi:hypothetical protein
LHKNAAIVKNRFAKKNTVNVSTLESVVLSPVNVLVVVMLSLKAKKMKKKSKGAKKVIYLR